MPANTDVFAKAKIVNLNTGEALVVHFNPQDFSFTREIKWQSESTVQGKDATKPTYAGGESWTIPSLTFVFDTTPTGQDVRDAYQSLVRLSFVDKRNAGPNSLPEPPKCRFEWGKFISFEAVITSLTQKFVLFKPNGTPVRAEVTVSFQQVSEPVPPQNPTSRSEARKIHIVHQGETLPVIAYQEYGDAACWRYIAETNDLADPKRLVPGQALKLLPLP
jgi:hypothetical protein